MVRKKSGTSHLLLIRQYQGKNFNRVSPSLNWKSDADKRARELRRKGFNVRIHHTPLEKYRYTLYKRKKGR